MPKLPGCARGITPLRPRKSTFLIVKKHDRLRCYYDTPNGVVQELLRI